MRRKKGGSGGDKGWKRERGGKERNLQAYRKNELGGDQCYSKN